MENKTSNLEQLLADVQKYVNLRLDDFKLRTVDGLSAVLSLLFSALACLLLLNMALIFIFGALAVWLSQCIGSLPWAMLITGGLFVVLVAILLILRKKLITNKLVSILVQLFFEKPESE